MELQFATVFIHTVEKAKSKVRKLNQVHLLAKGLPWPTESAEAHPLSLSLENF